MSTVVRTLEDLWQRGHLRDLEDDLDRFIRDNLTEIRRTLQEGQGGGLGIVRRRYNQGEISDRHLVDFCVRSVLRRKGSCNPRKDILEQRDEIEKEVWYEGERRQAPVPADIRNQIAVMWCKDHAGNWRDWRIFQLLYIWDKKAENYVQMIASGRDQ
jgi:hypothetical protein